MSITLAIKYRPHTWEDVVEQCNIKTILTKQLETNTIKNAYLFVGGAGTGKTTCARIFAQEINKHQGNPIEMDAASNSSVDDVRTIIQQASTKSLDSEYKIFIIDECHAISNTGWQAFLKLIEEPPAKSIFIFCTTDPQKIPKTILSRVQRYDFQRISHDGIVKRLKYICISEVDDDKNNGIMCHYDDAALEYIAKIADGGMRDAITLLDKCLSYNTDLNINNVINALGLVDFETMFTLTDSILENDLVEIMDTVDRVHFAGKDLKQFIKTYTNFMLDLCKYGVTKSMEFIDMPEMYEYRLKFYNEASCKAFKGMLKELIKLNSDIKWETSPKPVIVAELMLLGDKVW